MNYEKEFKEYAKKHLGLNPLMTDAVVDYQVSSSITPMIVEEREMRATVISVFDRLMMDRILFLVGPVNDRMSTVVCAQLLFLDTLGKRDINLYLDTPGGSVKSGLSMVDLMNYVSSDIATVNVGMCASMGSVLLSAGEKGKRSSLINAKVMIHQVSSGASGHVEDNRISQMEAEKYNYILFKMISKNCGKTFNEVYSIANRDKWFNSDQAVAFGLIDEVIGSNKSDSMTKMLEGFDDHYKKILSKIK